MHESISLLSLFPELSRLFERPEDNVQWRFFIAGKERMILKNQMNRFRPHPPRKKYRHAERKCDKKRKSILRPRAFFYLMPSAMFETLT